MTTPIEALQTDSALAADIDTVAALQSARAELSAKDAALKSQIDTLEEGIAAAMRSAGLTLAAGAVGAAALDTKEVWRVDPQQWNALYDHIRATGEFDLLTRTLSTTAVRERVKAGVEVPGVRRVEFEKLTVKRMGK